MAQLLPLCAARHSVDVPLHLAGFSVTALAFRGYNWTMREQNMLHLLQLEPCWSTVHTDVDVAVLPQLLIMLCINGGYFLNNAYIFPNVVGWG